MKITKNLFSAATVLFMASALFYAQEAEPDVTQITVTETAEEISETESLEEETVAAETSDSYEEVEALQQETVADTYTEEVSDTKDRKKKKSTVKNPFEGFFTPKQNKYNFYATIPLSTGTIGYGIKHREAEVFVDPKTKKAGIQTYYQTSFFDFMFDQKNIAIIAEAFDKYLQDFEAHNLIKNNTMKTRKIYSAKGKCRVEWGTIKAMINNYGDAQFHVGYEFKNKSPYFCIIIKDAKNIAPDLGSNVAEKSVEVQLYFTKAEARQFLDALSIERVKQELTEEVIDNDSY